MENKNEKKEIFFILELAEDKFDETSERFEKNYNIEILSKNSMKLTKKTMNNEV